MLCNPVKARDAYVNIPSAPVVQGWTTACDWLEAPLLGHSPCHRFIESCPQGVLRTIRVVIQPESSGWGQWGGKVIDACDLLSRKGHFMSKYAFEQITVNLPHDQLFIVGRFAVYVFLQSRGLFCYNKVLVQQTWTVSSEVIC